MSDAKQVLNSIRSVLNPDGSLIVLVPQSESLFGSIDETLGHCRRYDAQALAALLRACGFQIRRSKQLNKIGTPAWWLFSRVLQRKKINKVTLKIFDKTVWIWRLLDRILPWRGLSLIVVAGTSAAGSSE